MIKKTGVENTLKEKISEDGKILNQILIDYFKENKPFSCIRLVNAKNLKNNLKDLCVDNVYGQMFSYETDPDNNMYVHNFVPKDAKFHSGGSGFLVSYKTIRSIK